MRIAIVAPAAEGELGPALASGFLAHGHSVTLVGERRLTGGHGLYVRARRAHVDRSLLELAGRRLAERVSAAKPDCVVVVKGRFIAASTVRRLRTTTGAAVVNWCPDDPLHPPFEEAGWLQSLREFDLVAIWSELLSRKLAAAGIRAVAVPFGYDPSWYHGDGSESTRWDVVFVGQWSAEREAHIRALSGLAVGVTGDGWQRALAGTELAASVIPGRHFGREAAVVYRSSMIGLNIMHPQNAGTHNMRTWELPATGTPMVVTDTCEHRAIFQNGGAMFVHGPAATRAAVDELLADPTRRREVAARGRAAVSDGTYASRVDTLLHKLQTTTR